MQPIPYLSGEGSPEPRDVLICLHCSASSGRQWSALAESLADDLTVLTPDLLGYAEPTEEDLKHHAKAPKEKASETLDRVEAERKAARKKERSAKKKAASKEETKAVREKIEKASAARSQQ